jgi:hypothetical protein
MCPTGPEASAATIETASLPEARKASTSRASADEGNADSRIARIAATSAARSGRQKYIRECLLR